MATGDLILGDASRDEVSGTTDDDAILTGRGSDVIYNTDGDDYVDGGTGGTWWFAWDIMIFDYNFVDKQNMSETDEYYYKVYQLDSKTYVLDRFDVNDNRVESDLVRNVESFIFNNGKQHVWEMAAAALAVEIVEASNDGVGYSAVATDSLLHYKLFASAKNDSTLQGNDGHDKLFGATGNDLLLGGAGHDFLSGHTGDDGLFAGLGHDELHAGAGNDVLHGEEGHDYLDGGFGDDLLSGGLGNDTLHAGQGSDVLLGSEGSNTLTGGLGQDYFIVNQYSVWRDPSGVLLPGVESTTITDFTMGEDFLLAQAASGSPDSISPISDALELDQFNATYDANLGGVVLSGHPLLAADSTIILEGITQAQWDDYLIEGDASDNVLVATDGKPHALFGSIGSDKLIGGTGNDLLYGGSELANLDNEPQHDRLVPGKGDDLIIFESGTVRNPTLTGGVTVYQTLEVRGDSYEGANTILGPIGRNPSIRVDNIEVHYAVYRGDPHAEDIELFAFHDITERTFYTAYGNDGDALAENLIGFEAQLGQDDSLEKFIQAVDEEGTIVVFEARNPTLFSNHHKIVIDGNNEENHINAADNHFVGFAETEDLRHVINGYKGDDILTGASRNDILDGGKGDDILDGGGMLSSAGETEVDEIIKNADVLTGGKGDDTFVYEAGYNALVITDFDQKHDQIEVTGYTDTDMDINVIDGDTILSFADADDVITLQGFDDTLLENDVIFVVA